MNYEEAKAILDRLVFEEDAQVSPQDRALAIEKSLQAVTDCLEMGLNGIGD